MKTPKTIPGPAGGRPKPLGPKVIKPKDPDEAKMTIKALRGIKK